MDLWGSLANYPSQHSIILASERSYLHEMLAVTHYEKILGVLGCWEGPTAASARGDVAEAWDIEEEQTTAQVSARHFVGSVA